MTTDTCFKNLVLVEDVKIIYLGTVPSRVSVTFRHFKHSKDQPHVLEFDQGETQVSPIESLLAYLNLRSKQSVPLFVLNNGQVLSRSLFDNQLKKCLLFCCLDSSLYKSQFSHWKSYTLCFERSLRRIYLLCRSMTQHII